MKYSMYLTSRNEANVKQKFLVLSVQDVNSQVMRCLLHDINALFISKTDCNSNAIVYIIDTFFCELRAMRNM